VILEKGPLTVHTEREYPRIEILREVTDTSLMISLPTSTPTWYLADDLSSFIKFLRALGFSRCATIHALNQRSPSRNPLSISRGTSVPSFAIEVPQMLIL